MDQKKRISESYKWNDQDRESKDLIIKKDRQPKKDKRLTKRALKLFTLTTQSKATDKQHAKAHQINSEKFENSHVAITKFVLAQTKLNKFYPNIKIIELIYCFLFTNPKSEIFGWHDFYMKIVALYEIYNFLVFSFFIWCLEDVQKN